MSSYYDRRYEITLDDEVFIEQRGGRQFKIVFEILIDFGGYTSYADIAIYNLKKDTSNKVIKKGLAIGMKAGYVDNIDFIFAGTIKNVTRERNGVDTITRIIAKGGSQPTSTNMETTLGKNTKIVPVLTQISKALGYSIEINEADFDDIPPFIRGVTLNGDPRVLLDNYARTHSFSWVTEKNNIVIVRNGKHRLGQPVEINQFNGMEGIPEISEIGADVTVRLNPKIKIGGQINITSEYRTFNFSNVYYQDIPELAGTGTYNVYKIQHSGDSWAAAWATKITGLRDGESLA